MIIIGEETFAPEHLWTLIATSNQWTQQMERTLHMLSVNSEGDAPERYTLPMGEVHPFRLCDAPLPSDNTGFVYMLCSMTDKEFTYVGECENLPIRLSQHNSGNGSFGTSKADGPFYVAGYICGMKHCTVSKRMSLEQHWKDDRDNMPYLRTVLNTLELGERIVYNENRFNPDRDPISFVRMIRSSV